MTNSLYADIGVLLKTVDWPVMPEVGQALIRTFNDEDADIETVCRIIAKDPALTATLLRMANSAMFGLSGQVDTLERAVSVVGMTLIRARALSVCLSRVAKIPACIDRMVFWRNCMLCAGFSQWLAAKCQVDEQEAWLAGMMLPLGGISLCQASPQVQAALLAKPVEPGERWLRQRQLVGFDEGQVVAELAQHWDFPAVLVAGLRHAAQPLLSKENSHLAAVLHLAARLADSGAVNPDSLDALPLLVLLTLKLDVATLEADAPDAGALVDITMFQS
jgi:HD-like signal output (HDOD) protein